MKVVVVDNTIAGSLFGGAQTFLIDFLAGLRDRGHEVHFIGGGEPAAEFGDALRGTGALINTRPFLRGKLVDDVTPTVAEEINRLEPDVYVVSVSPDLGWTVLPFLDTRIATLAIGHNDEQTFYTPARHYRSFLTRAIGVSSEICRKYVEYSRMPKDRVDWIPYGVETADSPPVTVDGSPIRLVYVGRFDNTQKRVSDIVETIKGLERAGIDFRFDLVGDGDEMATVRSELSAQIASGKVQVHGWVDSRTVIDILRSNEVFVLASAYEGFCISLVEAMANGCCPVATDIASGNKQLIKDGTNGFIVPIGGVSSFVDRITLLAQDRKLLGEMRVEAWRTGKSYSVDRMVGDYVECFRRAIDDAIARPRSQDPNFPLMDSCRSKYPLWLRRIKARVAGTNMNMGGRYNKEL